MSFKNSRQRKAVMAKLLAQKQARQQARFKQSRPHGSLQQDKIFNSKRATQYKRIEALKEHSKERIKDVFRKQGILGNNTVMMIDDIERRPVKQSEQLLKGMYDKFAKIPRTKDKAVIQVHVRRINVNNKKQAKIKKYDKWLPF